MGYEVHDLLNQSLSFRNFASKKEVIEPDKPTPYVTKIVIICYAIFLIVDKKKLILDLVVRNLH
jgi:hypothetical protein